MASCLKLKRVQALDQVYKIGDRDQNFYIILRGVVSTQVPNKSMPDRALKWHDFNSLLDWKSNEFDPLVDQA